MIRKKLQTNLRFGFTISLLLLLASAVASYYAITQLIASSRLVDHTHEVLKVSEEVISDVKDGETGQRGYLLTEQQDFLEPFNGSFEKAMNAWSRLKVLTTDNPEQQQNCDSLEILIRKRFAILQQGIEDKKVRNQVNIFLLRDGITNMHALRLLVQKIQHIEEGLLLQRTSKQKTFIGYAPMAVLVASILSLLITLFFFRQVLNDSRQKEALNLSLRKKDEETGSRINIIQNIAGKIAAGEYAVRVSETESDELGNLSASLNKMAQSLQQTFDQLQMRDWIQSGTTLVSEKIAGEKTVSQLATEAIEFISVYTKSITGALYISDKAGSLALAGGYALADAPQRLHPGEGLAGQCWLSKKELFIENIGHELYTLSTGGPLKPKALLLYPIMFEGSVLGIIELGSMTSFSSVHTNYLKNIGEILGISINTAINRTRLKELLEETQAQSEELQAQHSELENMNAELEVQAEKLQTSEEELKVQQEELMETNQELEERSRLLEEKNQLVLVRNLDIQKKAEQLEETTRYKSEFLANMSHELRTPLNSILLLSRLLGDNNPGNLSSDQVEYAKVIQSSGSGLLQLIDEILDLSKIESGKLEMEYEDVAVSDILENMRMLFAPIAREKEILLTFTMEEGVSAIIETDRMKIEQIMKNLISNALKFTPAGFINTKVSASEDGMIRFSIQDSGIGVPKEKQEQIFGAFQQADGSTKRKYGGTGLGLSISRQLAKLLGGQITLESSEGQGSNFILTLPITKAYSKNEIELEKLPEATDVVNPLPSTQALLIAQEIPATLPDDRNNIQSADKILLIVEDDVAFARALLDFARQKEYRAIHCVRGDEVLELAVKFKPTGILLDIQLPVKDGLSVMDDLKKDPRVRHIPVHIMSSYEVKKESLMRGAVDFIIKPVVYEQMTGILKRIEEAVNTDLKKVLIVEDDSYHARALSHFLSLHHISSAVASEVKDGIVHLQRNEVDCVILDMGLTGQPEFEMLEQVKKNPSFDKLAIIIFTGKNLSRGEEQRIRKYADIIVVKTAHSYQRILNEVSLFLHLVEEPKDKKSNGKGLGSLDEVIGGKTVLVADDDVRNIFALTKALEKHKMNIVTAIDGKEALEKLKTEQKIDIVLMDMMMPEMDGYETITQIRLYQQWKRLPIIALTAKAMTGDREKCIQAGASDYISKPVDTDQLLSLMRVWLYES